MAGPGSRTTGTGYDFERENKHKMAHKIRNDRMANPGRRPIRHGDGDGVTI